MSDRMFLAVAIDDEIRHALAAHLDAVLGDRRLPGKLVPVANWHITLRFLGPTTPAQAETILAHLDDHLATEPFRVRLTGLGGFPKERKASVLWLGLDGDVDSLAAMAAECEQAAQRAGMEPEDRPFHPHLTLSRLRPPVDIRSLVDEIEPIRLTMDVGAVTLYRSQLGGGPARYDVVDTVSL